VALCRIIAGIETAVKRFRRDLGARPPPTTAGTEAGRFTRYRSPASFAEIEPPLRWDRWIEKLETPTRKLERALKEPLTETGASEGSLRQKHLDLELYDRQVHAAARWIGATFELADRKSYGRSLLPFTQSRLRHSGTETVEEPSFEPSVGATADETEVSPTPPSASAARESKDG